MSDPLTAARAWCEEQNAVYALGAIPGRVSPLELIEALVRMVEGAERDLETRTKQVLGAENRERWALQQLNECMKRVKRLEEEESADLIDAELQAERERARFDELNKKVRALVELRSELPNVEMHADAYAEAIDGLVAALEVESP